VTGKLRHAEDIQRADFEFLRSVTSRTPKVTVPSPTMVHFRGGRQAIDIDAYPDLDEFFSDLARCYRAEVDSLYRAGCQALEYEIANVVDPAFTVVAKARKSFLPRR
jgi:5-methyltetrahydropteroyltriglutamate--homocysteine methyltransferase